jgi:pimeloyl-ACP methyl ester carboxylesterase
MPSVYARRWAELLPHARVTSVADGGHMLPYERPADLAREVTTFLTGPSA